MSQEPQFEFDENGLPRRVFATEEEKTKDSSKQKSNRGRRRVSGEKIVHADDLVFQEKLPNGGPISLMNPHEVTYYRGLRDRYIEEYPSLIQKANDVNRLSQLLTLELIVQRQSQRLLGQVVLYDRSGAVTGVDTVDQSEISIIAQNLPKIQEEIRKLESALKIDKRTREGSGEADIKAYMTSLKRAAVQKKIQISERYAAYDVFVNELRWRMRVFNNGDEEDSKHHGVETAEKVMNWADGELKQLEAVDKEFAATKNQLWVGKI